MMEVMTNLIFRPGGPRPHVLESSLRQGSRIPGLRQLGLQAACLAGMRFTQGSMPVLPFDHLPQELLLINQLLPERLRLAGRGQQGRLLPCLLSHGSLLVLRPEGLCRPQLRSVRVPHLSHLQLQVAR